MFEGLIRRSAELRMRKCATCQKEYFVSDRAVCKNCNGPIMCNVPKLIEREEKENVST